jgi:hypothetical protein
MQRIVELELWSRPRTSIAPQDGKAVAEACRNDTGLSQEVVLGLNFVPDKSDVENLQLALAAGEVTLHEFKRYCAKQQLEPAINSTSSAAAFLAYANGQPLAWCHFPAGPEGYPMARLTLQWAGSMNLLLVIAHGEQSLREAHLAELWHS